MPQKTQKKNIHRMSFFVFPESARRGSNPRPPPWQGGAPPLSHSRIDLCYTTPILNSPGEIPCFVALRAIKRVMGIEPTYPAWKAGVLPLNYTRIYMKQSTFLRAKTHRSNLLQMPRAGIEPATRGFSVLCSTN